MKKIFVILIGLLLMPVAALQAVVPAKLRCEYRDKPIGIDVIHPWLSWLIESQKSEPRGQRQTAYQVLVASSEALLRKDRGDLWDSGKVNSDQQTQVPYAGKPLTSSKQFFWKIRVWDQRGAFSAWSPVAN